MNSGIERGGGRPDKGAYLTPSGKKLPSVTTILGATIPKPALVQWAYNRGASGVALYASRDAAADIGQAVHDAAEEYEATGARTTFELLRDIAEGEEDISPRAAARNAFETFLNWRWTQDLEVIALEVPLVSERLGYAGTPDMIAKRDGVISILDWKTGKGVYPEYLAQIAAYALLWEDLRGGSVEGFEILRLAKDGSNFERHGPWSRAQLEDAGVFATWRRLVEIHQMQSSVKALIKPKSKREKKAA